MNEHFKCPVCRSCYFGSLWENGKLVGRYCKGWPSSHDRSYIPCSGNYVKLFDAETNAEVITKFTDAVFDLAKNLAGISAPAPAQQEQPQQKRHSCDDPLCAVCGHGHKD